jgi:transcriptional regulator with XRE-family HTH domain
MAPTRTLGLRSTMSPNQIVAYNVAKARLRHGWTQEEAAQALAPYLGTRLSAASFSALERSASNPDRVKVFSADELLALSRAFDVPIGYFFTPPPPSTDTGLHAPDAGLNGLDPIVLLDAVLGTATNRAIWEQQLLDYAASTAPAPRNKRHKPNTSPSDLAERLEPFGAVHAKALLRQAFGDLDDASIVLERLADAIHLLNDTPPEPAPNTPARTVTKAKRRRASA